VVLLTSVAISPRQPPRVKPKSGEVVLGAAEVACGRGKRGLRGLGRRV